MVQFKHKTKGVSHTKVCDMRECAGIWSRKAFELALEDEKGKNKVWLWPVSAFWAWSLEQTWLPDHSVFCHGKSLLGRAGDQLALGQLRYSGVQCMREILGHLLFRSTEVPVYLCQRWVSNLVKGERQQDCYKKNITATSNQQKM